MMSRQRGKSLQVIFPMLSHIVLALRYLSAASEANTRPTPPYWIPPNMGTGAHKTREAD